jgi:pimeloyl-ACP methyl ester carboxylesterase
VNDPSISRRPSSRLPPLSLLLTEVPRAALDFASLAAAPWLATAPRGDGHPVLVLPGFFATDAYTLALRTYLRTLGYEVETWGAGRNWGRWDALEAIVVPKVEQMQARYGRKVSVVGASMGGLYARAAGHRIPAAVRCVISLSSAAQRSADRTYITPLYEAATQQDADSLAVPAAPVPCTSVVSRLDGLSDWQPALLPAGEQAENIEVLSSHLGMAWHPAVLYLVADRLAQAEGAWTPFRPPAWGRMFYPQGAVGSAA